MSGSRPGIAVVQATAAEQGQTQPSAPPGLMPTSQQQNSEQGVAVSEPGAIGGTVTDVNDVPIPSASVVLQGPAPSNRRTVTTDANGFYEIGDVQPGVPYHI